MGINRGTRHLDPGDNKSLIRFLLRERAGLDADAQSILAFQPFFARSRWAYDSSTMIPCSSVSSASMHSHGRNACAGPSRLKPVTLITSGVQGFACSIARAGAVSFSHAAPSSPIRRGWIPLLLIGLVLYLDLASWSLGPFASGHSRVQRSDSRSATQNDQISITFGVPSSRAVS